MKVSVVIPAYNHQKYIGAAISSVLDQSYSQLELIIINDGSTDNTEQEILKFKDTRIKYVTQTNAGAHNAINKGITLAEGEYVSILNSDDVYDRYRLEKCLNFLEDRKDFSVVITEVCGINEEGISVTTTNTPQVEAWIHWYKDALCYCESLEFMLCAFAKNILITTSNYFIRKELFSKVGMFRALRYAHDWDMLLRLAKSCKVHLMRDVLLQYRFHQSNTVHEQDSEKKVKLEVNWLIAENIRQLKNNVDVLELMNSIRNNHYIDFKLLALFLMIKDNSQLEMFLDCQNAATVKAMELLK